MENEKRERIPRFIGINVAARILQLSPARVRDFEQEGILAPDCFLETSSHLQPMRGYLREKVEKLQEERVARKKRMAKGR